MSRVQIPFWPPADVVLSSPQFNFSAMPINSQLVCLPPVGILNLIMFISILIYHCWFAVVLKIPNGEWPIMYTFSFYIFTFYLQYKSGCNVPLSLMLSEFIGCADLAYFHEISRKHSRDSDKPKCVRKSWYMFNIFSCGVHSRNKSHIFLGTPA